MAQWLAQRLYTPLVGGSNPSSPTISKVFIFKIFEACSDHFPSKVICFIDCSLTTTAPSRTLTPRSALAYNQPYNDPT